MPDNAPEFTATQARELFMTLVGAVGDNEIKEVFKSAVLAKAGLQDSARSYRLSPDEVIRDLFFQRELHQVPTPGTIQVGPPIGATGESAEATNMHYSRWAPQPQALTKEYEKFESELGSLRAYMKAQSEAMATQMQAMAKTLEAVMNPTVKGEDEKVEIQVEEEEDEKSKSFKALRDELLSTLIGKAEEEEGDEEEEEEMGKSLSAAFRVTLAKATLRAVKDLSAKSDLSKVAKSNLKAVCAKALRKAHGLAKATSEDKTVAKAAAEALRATEEYMFLRGIPLTVKAKPMAKKEGMEDEGNQKKWPADESMKSLGDITAALEATQTDIKGLFDMLSHRSKSSTALETVDVPAAMLQGASGKVKSLFSDVKVEA